MSEVRTSDTNPRTLSKPCFDIGYFTADPGPMLAFWREEMGLAHEAPVPFNAGLVQYRHALGGSVLKINTAPHPLPGSPTGYRELLVARDGLTAPRTLHDPDGNPITLVPRGHDGISGLALRVAVADLARYRHFCCTALGFTEIGAGRFLSGDSLLIAEQDDGCRPAGHWVDAGLRYFTLHVMRVDDAFAAVTGAGATVGERPYSIGRVARISFVRDPDGNWIEIAQRAALAGPWWTDA